MATSWCRLRRQDDGEVLVLDGVVGFRVIDDVAVTELPVEGGADVSDNVVERARMVMLDVEVSDLPVASDVTTTGQDRLEEVLTYLQQSVGRLLTLTTVDRPTYTNLLLTSRGSPTHDPANRSSRLIVSARETVRAFANQTTATQTGGAPLGRAAADGGPAADRGDVGAGPQRGSLAASVADGLRALTGL